MEHNIKIEQNYLGIPIQPEQPEENLEIFLDGEKIFEFRVPVCKDLSERKYEYYSYLNLKEYKGRSLTLKGSFDQGFFEGFIQSDAGEQPALKRPLLHFTAERGWINDPNGLVYHNGRYHLFFQYNPVNTQWQNMSWGHSVSTDLLHFKQTDNVLYPDQNGAVIPDAAWSMTEGFWDCQRTRCSSSIPRPAARISGARSQGPVLPRGLPTA